MKAYRNTADLILIIAALVILAGFILFATGSAGASAEGQYPNPYYIVCDDPLLTNVTLVNACGMGASTDEKQDEPANVPAVVTVEPDTRPQEPNQEFPYEPPIIVPQEPETPVVVPTPETPETPAEDTCEHGNPGNTKCVGNAGEDPNGAGTMPQDNAGGGGNGEHGNQGQGGNKPEKEDKSK